MDDLSRRRALKVTASTAFATAGAIAYGGSPAYAQKEGDAGQKNRPDRTSNQGIVIQFPRPFQGMEDITGEAPAAKDSFNVAAQGYGSFTGLAYTVPAHTSGNIKAKIQTPALTSQNIKDLNTLIEGMVSASVKTYVRDYERTHASANVSYWAFWSGGGSASYEKTHENMRSSGLSEEQVTTIVNKMLEIAKTMSKVEIDFNVNNSANDYAVSGSLLIYTLSGTISTSNGQAQYRVLANKGIAGSGDASAPAGGDIIPLS
ncbi:hypothetical protein SAMN05444166_7273 [Singulisphaera sp. GP187]|uniref:hypothetical protein n=1 Tax=Singulisphaera sp. GP187 TaxID=1882752 RepID=UPI00092AF108|nr:hypothetical protein [Singulisphaera sp. GP187]SIO63194.1 hypothetical protein SAMN05444166_7273 [Singulisphaera sp. GP187]